MMGLFDMFLPKQSGTGRSQGGAYDGFQLDPALKQYMEQQRTREFFDRIARMGQGMIEAGSRGADFFPALAMGISRASGYGRGRGPGRGGSGLLDVLEMQRKINAIRTQQGKQRKEREYQDLISGGSGLGPDGIDWNAPRPGNPDLTKGMSVAQRGLLSSLSREEGLGVLKKQAFKPPAKYNAPTVVMGSNGEPQLVRFPQGQGTPVPVAGYGPYERPRKATMGDRKLALLNKYRAAQDGRIEWTDADQAEWDMIIQADPMDIMRRNIIRGMGRDPAASISGSDTPPPSGASAEGPDIFERGYNYLFGSDVEAGQSAPGGNGAASPIPSPGPSPESGAYPSPPRRRPAREIDGPTQPIPRDATGKIDAQRLDVGQVYEKADGTRWRWGGQNFTEVQ